MNEFASENVVVVAECLASSLSTFILFRSTLNANVDALDDAVLNMKKLHGKVMWEKKKKMDAYDKLEKQYNNMKTVEERTQKEMEK